MLGILVAMFYGLHRVIGIRLGSWISTLLLLVFAAFYIYHISYLTFWKFDYGYNMKAAIAVGLSHNIMWLYWSVKSRTRLPHAYKMGIVVLSLTLTALLEVFDFPAIYRILDAHALWHLSTIPCVMMYWDFLLIDAKFILQAKLQ